MIVSKRHKYKFYFSIGLVSVVFLGLGIISIYGFYYSYVNGNLQLKNYPLPFFGFGCLVMPLYSVYQYFKNSPKIELDKDSIKLKWRTREEFYYLSSFDNIELTGKIPFRYIIRFPMEGITIKIKNGKTIYLFDDMYSNTWQIKKFLEDIVINKKEPQNYEETQIDNSSIDYDFMDLYKGNQITSLRGITLWGLIGFFLILLLLKGGNPPMGFYIFFFCFGSFWFFFNSYLMHYFGIDKEFLIIRNHNLIWINKVYKIPEIKEVVFETQGNMPNCLRVITKNFKSKLYPAGTLRTNDWLALKDALEKQGIVVRNECIF